MDSDHVEAIIEAAADSPDVQQALGDMTAEELEWLVEDDTPPADEDPTPPDPSAVAWRDKWLAEKVRKMVRPYEGE